MSNSCFLLRDGRNSEKKGKFSTKMAEMFKKADAKTDRSTEERNVRVDTPPHSFKKDFLERFYLYNFMQYLAINLNMHSREVISHTYVVRWCKVRGTCSYMPALAFFGLSCRRRCTLPLWVA